MADKLSVTILGDGVEDWLLHYNIVETSQILVKY